MAVAASRYRQAQPGRPGTQLTAAAVAHVRELNLDGPQAEVAQLEQAVLCAIIGRVGPGRNAASAADQPERLSHGQPPLGHDERAAVMEVARERFADRRRPPR